MRRSVTSLVIAAMTIALLSTLLSRERSPHDAPAAAAAGLELAAAGDAGLADGGRADAAVHVDAVAEDAALTRPLRVATLGWEFAVPAAALDPAKDGARLEVAPEISLSEVEARLARGGDDPQGADVAVMPLPAFVWSFDRLRALEPRAFLVVGFSRGREEVRAAPGALVEPPPAASEVTLAAFGPSSAGPAARAAGSESATVFGLFALDLLGVAPSRLRVVAPGTSDAASARYAALVRGAPDDRKLVLSTADAPRFVPVVAVAPRALLDARGAALGAWARAWLEGLARSSQDVPTLARRLAAKEGLPLAAGASGAPEALALVERLGQVDDASVGQQASLIGPLATGPVTLDALTRRTWQLARAAGFAGAAPEPLPIDPRIVAALGASPTPPSAPPPADAGAGFGAAPAGATVLVAYRAAAGDVEQVAAQIAFLSGVFDRTLFDIRAKGGVESARAIAAAAAARGVPGARLATRADEPRGAFAVVDVLAAP